MTCYVKGALLVLALFLFIAAETGLCARILMDTLPETGVAKGYFEAVQQLGICELSDTKCITRAAKKTFERMVPGIPGLLRPLDPLHEDRIEGETPTMKYILTNITLHGMKNCHVQSLKYIPTGETYDYIYQLQCTRLVLTADYTAKGTLGPASIDHEGSFIISIDEYDIILNEKTATAIDKTDNKLRLYVENYEIFKADAKGRVTYEQNIIRKGDKEQGDGAVKYFNENSQSVAQLFRNPVIDKLFSIYMKALNVYLRTVPIEDIFADDDES